MTEFVEQAEKDAIASMPDLESDKKKKGALKTLRAACITVFDYTQSTIDILSALVEKGEATYVVFQEEISPQTGKPHLQGYVEFGGTVRWNKIQTLLDNKCHVERRAGIPSAAASYCKKLDTRKPGSEPHEFGVISRGQGARNELETIKLKIDAGATKRQLWTEHFPSMLRYHKGFTDYRETMVVPRSRMSVSVMLHGASGTDNSRLSAELFPDQLSMSPGNNGIWYDKYQQQEAIVYDEFTG